MSHNWNLPVASQKIIPEHCVLSVVALWDPVVHVMCLGVKELDAKHFKDHVVPGVVETSHETSRDHKQQTREWMDRKATVVEVDGQQMVVLSKHKLNGMHIDRVGVAATTDQRKTHHEQAQHQGGKRARAHTLPFLSYLGAFW